MVMAEVAAVYNVNPFSLADDELSVMRYMLPHVRAFRECDSRRAKANLDAVHLEKLVYNVSLDRMQAEKTVAQWKLKNLD